MPPKNSSSRRSSKSPSIRRKKTYPKVSLYPNWKSDDETDDEELTIWEDITKEDREMKVEYEKNLERAKALKYANSSKVKFHYSPSGNRFNQTMKCI